jgi:hypothetical protein
MGDELVLLSLRAVSAAHDEMREVVAAGAHREGAEKLSESTKAANRTDLSSHNKNQTQADEPRTPLREEHRSDPKLDEADAEGECVCLAVVQKISCEKEVSRRRRERRRQSKDRFVG